MTANASNRILNTDGTDDVALTDKGRIWIDGL